MSFKPHRDSQPLEQRPLSVQLEAQFHMAIRDKLTKRQQGYVIGRFPPCAGQAFPGRAKAG